MAKVETEKVYGLFLVTCMFFGAVVGCVGTQAFGLAILASGIGAFVGAVFGGKRIFRALVETIREMDE
jgi:phosphate/sulfate permease